MIELANIVGSPLVGPNGRLVKEIRVSPQAAAKTGTLSASFGTKGFPLHTDTAFLPIPARYIILRAFGDTRRPTTVLSFRQIVQNCGKHIVGIANRSVWYLRTPSLSTYCSMRFRESGLSGWRYDRQCMFPANETAREIANLLDGSHGALSVEQIAWSGDCAAVISNWEVLHGRGSEPDLEGERVLERIYVGCRP